MDRSVRNRLGRRVIRCLAVCSIWIAAAVFAFGTMSLPVQGAVKKTVTVKLTKKGSVKTLTVEPGTIIKIRAKQGNKTISTKKLKYTSYKKKVATVSSSGIVTTKKKGTVKIRVKRKGVKRSAVLKITVRPRTYTYQLSKLEPAENVTDTLTDTVPYSVEALEAHTYSSALLPHVHTWVPITFSDPDAAEYPAERCTECRLERWTESAEEEKTPGRFIMIGDSYGARSSSWGGNYTWPYQVAKALGLRDGQAYIACRGGYGFAVSGNFTNLLRLIDPDPEVTCIFVVGGIGNDKAQSEAAIKSGCKVFAMEANYRFPNAKVVYAAPNTHVSNSSWLEKLAEHRPWYIAACKENGWIYLDGCEEILAGQPEYFQADGHHPNAEGEVVLGAALAARLKAVL